MSSAARKSLPFLIPLILFAVLAGFGFFGLYGTLTGSRSADQLPSVLVGRDAPALPGSALGPQRAQGLDAFAGQPVLVNFMASWCAPCRAEVPALDLLSKEVAIIAIAYKDKPEDTQRFLDQFGDPYEAVWMDFDGDAGRRWGVYGVPETFVIDQHGKVVLRHAGPVFSDVIETEIRPALEALK